MSIQHVVDNSLAPRTRKNYESAVRCFLAFCKLHNIPEHLCFPADKFVLSAFAASFAGKKSGQTVANQLAGLKAWHEANNVKWAGGTRLAFVSRGVTNMTPDSSKKPPRPPVTTEMLLWLREALDPDVPFDAAVLAIALAAFWGQCRLSELLGSARRNTTNPDLPLLASIGPRTSSSGTREVHLPKTKTSRVHGQKIILTRQESRLDALRAIAHSLKISRITDKSSNIFIYRQGHGNTFRAVTKEQFLRKCNEIWSAKGIPHVTGHSFRIGGTAELLDKGVPVDLVKEMGRWRSDAFHKYWRGIGVVAPRHANNVHTHASAIGPPGGQRSSQAVRRSRVA